MNVLNSKRQNWQDRRQASNRAQDAEAMATLVNLQNNNRPEVVNTASPRQDSTRSDRSTFSLSNLKADIMSWIRRPYVDSMRGESVGKLAVNIDHVSKTI